LKQINSNQDKELKIIQT